MTTIDTAAACARRSVTFASVFAVFALGLAGCETSTNLLGSLQPSAPGATEAPGAPATTAALPKGKVAIAPVIGAPDALAKQLQAQLGAALEKQSMGVAQTPSDKSDYTLRGYIVAAREKTNVKISYIWDVTDPAGKRVNRIQGEELVPSGQGKDPWAVMTPQVSQSVADRTAQSLAAWLPGQGQPGSASAGPAKPAAPVQVATNSPNIPLSATPAAGSAGPVTALVPNVAGAPGDGGASLKAALERELTRSGVSLTGNPGDNTYQVQGRVIVGQGKDGKQPIQIDWDVKDPKGKKLGTVSQKNEIPQGSLDGAWGKTADAAASAATQGILKLLPPAKSVN